MSETGGRGKKKRHENEEKGQLIRETSGRERRGRGKKCLGRERVGREKKCLGRERW